MVTSASKGMRVAAGIVCPVFAPFVLIHLLWAVGVAWGLDEVSGGHGQNDAGLSLTAASLLVELADRGLRRVARGGEAVPKVATGRALVRGPST